MFTHVLVLGSTPPPLPPTRTHDFVLVLSTVDIKYICQIRFDGQDLKLPGIP